MLPFNPDASFVVVHLSVPADEGDRAAWLSRYTAFAASSGASAEDARTARAAVEAHLTVLTPEQGEAVLRDAGFEQVGLFYAGFTFRRWVAYA